MADTRPVPNHASAALGHARSWPAHGLPLAVPLSSLVYSAQCPLALDVGPEPPRKMMYWIISRAMVLAFTVPYPAYYPNSENNKCERICLMDELLYIVIKTVAYLLLDFPCSMS